MRIEAIRRGLPNRLRERRSEIEQATLTRIYSVADSSESSDPEYTEGLRAAVAAAIDYGIAAVERSEANPAPIPVVLLSQARLAARHGVKLETVLRRYLAGYTLLGDFLIEESERGGPLDGASLKRLLRVQAALLDRLVAAVSAEYAREAQSRSGSTEERRATLVQRLLAGEVPDAADLSYDFAVWHIAVVATGVGAAVAVRALTRDFDCRLLFIQRDEGTVWAWLGRRQRFGPVEFDRIASSSGRAQLPLSIGAPGEGLVGWRLTHRQAAAALPIARRRQSPVLYADVALLACVLQDDLLATSLRELYLAPLEHERDGGKAMRDTLSA